MGVNRLKGVEYLTSSDKLCIFYSQCCGKIRADYMGAIVKSGCNLSNVEKGNLILAGQS